MKTLTAQQKNSAVQKLGGAILTHVAAGKTVEQAFDLVMGAGAFTKLAGEVYDALRAQSRGA